MAFAHRIRLSFGESLLRKKIRGNKRIKQACNFNQARTAGIIFDASDPGNFEPIKNLASLLNEHKIHVQILGFVNEKRVPEAYFLRRSFNFFCRADLSWIYHPKSKFIEEFILKPYDILFDLDFRNNFPIRHITSLSAAHFKAGLYKEENEQLDFMISLNSNPTLESLISHLIEYLGNLKTKADPVLSEVK